MQDIATDAGVSKGLIHYHFQNKNELIAEALLWALRSTEVRILERLENNSASHDPIAGIVDAVFVDAQQNRDFYLTYLDVVDHIARVPELREFAATVQDMVERRYVDILAQQHALGRLGRADFTVAASDMRLIIDGTFLQWLLVHDWQDRHAEFALQCKRLLQTVLLDKPND